MLFRSGGLADQTPMPKKVPEQPLLGRNGKEVDAKAGNWWFDHDASILRGVESFGASAATMRKIKSKVLTPSGDIHSPKEMVDRYKTLMRMLSPPDDAEQTNSLEKEWRLPGRNRGTWLSPGQIKRKRGSTSTPGTEKKH